MLIHSPFAKVPVPTFRLLAQLSLRLISLSNLLTFETNTQVHSKRGIVMLRKAGRKKSFSIPGPWRGGEA